MSGRRPQRVKNCDKRKQFPAGAQHNLFNEIFCIYLKI